MSAAGLAAGMLLSAGGRRRAAPSSSEHAPTAAASRASFGRSLETSVGRSPPSISSVRLNLQNAVRSVAIVS